MIDMLAKKELQDLKKDGEYTIHHDALGNALRQYREARGVALSEIARHLGLQAECLAMLEIGADTWTLPVLAHYLIACSELAPLIYEEN